MAKYLLSPFQRFANLESLSGILLFSATIVALLWANSPLGESYTTIWTYKLSIGFEGFSLSKPISLWINDGLMAIFFFVIGLEIKRELLLGELNTMRKASLPIFAAIGGMLIPLGIFLLLNNDPETARGWGIPMATDIAFSLAILKLLGKSAPLSLKIFLTAFAIIDDLGAVLIIAIFYSGGINWTLILISIVLLAFLFYLSYRKLYFKNLTLIVGIVIWVLFLKSGIHPTIAGVLIAFTIPIRQKVNVNSFMTQLSTIANKIRQSAEKDQQILTKNQLIEIDHLENLVEDFHSPLQHAEHKLHSWVAYFIMPLFALANAGIVFGMDMDVNTALVLNIILALVLGKLIGISLFSFLAIKLKIAELPGGTNFIQIIGVAVLAGVGFTMSIFIANLAFTNSPLFMDSAKIGILAGSLISALLGALLIKIGSKNNTNGSSG